MHALLSSATYLRTETRGNRAFLNARQQSVIPLPRRKACFDARSGGRVATITQLERSASGTSFSLPPCVSRRGLFNTNQRLSLTLKYSHIPSCPDPKACLVPLAHPLSLHATRRAPRWRKQRHTQQCSRAVEMVQLRPRWPRSCFAAMPPSLWCLYSLGLCRHCRNCLASGPTGI